jgi:hypothetical protein
LLDLKSKRGKWVDLVDERTGKPSPLLKCWSKRPEGPTWSRQKDSQFLKLSGGVLLAIVVVLFLLVVVSLFWFLKLNG